MSIDWQISYINIYLKKIQNKLINTSAEDLEWITYFKKRTEKTWVLSPLATLKHIFRSKLLFNIIYSAAKLICILFTKLLQPFDMRFDCETSEKSKKRYPLKLPFCQHFTNILQTFCTFFRLLEYLTRLLFCLQGANLHNSNNSRKKIRNPFSLYAFYQLSYQLSALPKD